MKFKTLNREYELSKKQKSDCKICSNTASLDCLKIGARRVLTLGLSSPTQALFHNARSLWTNDVCSFKAPARHLFLGHAVSTWNARSHCSLEQEASVRETACTGLFPKVCPLKEPRSSQEEAIYRWWGQSSANRDATGRLCTRCLDVWNRAWSNEEEEGWEKSISPKAATF